MIVYSSIFLFFHMKLQLKSIALILVAFILFLSGATVHAGPYSSTMKPEMGPGSDFELLPKDRGTVSEKSEKGSAKIDHAGKGFTINLSKKAIALAGYIINKEIDVGSIVKILNNTLTVSENETVFIDIGKEKGVKKGDRFTIFSNERIIYDPVKTIMGTHRGSKIFSKPFDYWGKMRNSENRELGQVRPSFDVPEKEIIGILIQILGFLEVTEPLEGYSQAIIKRAHNDIQMGDLLMPYSEAEVPEKPSKKSNKNIEGLLIAFKEERVTGVAGDIIYIDRGSDDNVETGDFFEAYNIPTLKRMYGNEEKIQTFPPHVIGKIQIISTQKNNSSAVILYSENDFALGQKLRYLPENKDN